MLMLSTLFVVPVLGILIVALLDGPAEFVGLAAIFCFVGGLLRMLYALMMEDPYPQLESNQVAPYAPPPVPQFDRSMRNAALPPAPVNAAPSWRPQPNTAELAHRPSVTENTTRLLDKDDPHNR